MRKLFFINPEMIVWESGEQCTLDDLPGLIGSEAVLFAVVPDSVGRVLASKRTLDSAIAHQFPGPQAFAIEQLDDVSHQVFALSEDLLMRLRSVSKKVEVVPYPAAARLAVSTERTETGIFERTRVFFAAQASGAASTDKKDRIIIDSLGDHNLVTVMSGNEIISIRYALAGQPEIEMQRTLGANRLEDPEVITKDRQLALELQAYGYNARQSELPGIFVGESFVEKVLALRFQTQMDAVLAQRAKSQSMAALLLTGSLVLAGLSGLVFGSLHGIQNAAVREGQRLEAEKAEKVKELASLLQDRYGTIAQERSIGVREELLDLSISLPPQVTLVSIDKDTKSLKAVIERRPGAAPFGREDLRSALEASPFFADARIQEEYEGHVIRYLLTKQSIPPLTMQ